MKNFNWGHGIFVFYVIFVGTMISVVIASTKVDRSLVKEDYYSLDLSYQSHYNKVANGLNDQSIEITYDSAEELVKISSDEAVVGMATFYRPSNSKLDFKKQLKSANSYIDTKDLAKGVWVVQVNYKLGEEAFYIEEKLYL